jgi:hypothetical protein
MMITVDRSQKGVLLFGYYLVSSEDPVVMSYVMANTVPSGLLLRGNNANGVCLGSSEYCGRYQAEVYFCRRLCRHVHWQRESRFP